MAARDGRYVPIRDQFLPGARRLQEQGKCRFLGITDAFSDNDKRGQLMQAIADDDFDSVMVGYNLLTPGPAQDVLPAVSVTAAAYKFAANHPAVSCVQTGTANVEHLEDNVQAILGPRLPVADHQRLAEVFGPIGRKLGN